MVDKSAKKRRKGYLSEEDVCSLLLKYSATQVLTLLREVAQSPNVKIDWDALVKKTATGIVNAREYQMLWRHLAYRQPLIEKVESGAQPLDDDSDLEYELEVSPPVSTELLMEAANCVKVLASGLANESTTPNNPTVEGEMPSGHPSRTASQHPNSASLLHNSSPTLPVSIQRQSQLAGMSSEGLDATNNNYPSRRKRKPWSEEEDLELIAAVRKFGESNWSTITKVDHKWDRTASQLSQRWAIIKKRPGFVNIGGVSAAAAAPAGVQLTEQQLATRHALDMALKDTLTAVGNGAAGASTTNLNASNGDSPVTNNTVPSQVAPLSGVTNTISVKPGPVGVSMPRSLPKKAPAKPSVTADSIQAAAVAAGARIASPSDAAAASLKMAAQMKNAVHIRGTGTLVKSSAAGIAAPLPSNVHLINTGLAAAPRTVAAGTPSYPAGGHQAKGSTVKPSAPAASVSQLSTAKTARTVPSSFANELQQMEDKISAEVKLPGSDTKPKLEVQEDCASLSRCLPRASTEKVQSTSPNIDVDLSKQTADVDNAVSQCAMDIDMTEHKDEVCDHATKNHVPEDGNDPDVQGSGDPIVNGKLKVLSSSCIDGITEKMEVSSEALAGAEKAEQMDL